MEPIVKEFIERAQAKEREAYEKERDEFLVSLGLCEEGEGFVKREYGARYGFPYVIYDAEKKAYYREIKGNPVKVTDEEYELLKRYYGKNRIVAPKTNDSSKNGSLGNSAEKFLNTINTLVLIVACAVGARIIIEGFDSNYAGETYVFGGIALISISLISYAVVKVLLNISNNLHEINSKLK